MSTRNPMNKRSQAQQSGEASGFTRKSVASAKPARSAASSVRVVPASSKEKRRQAQRGESLVGLSKEEKRARKKEQRLREDRAYAVSNELLRGEPEYKSRRRVFWALLAVGIVATLFVWAMMVFAPSENAGTMQIAQIAGLVVAYAAIIGSFIYDIVRIRPLRNDARSRAEGMSESKQIALLEQVAAERASKKK
ncbi:hypothetical protein [Collinsella tanakaei]|uniref:hypothetical protein n=1 Tax=Collinsella tanakaei TaxID=626935 RepID=UPI001F186A4C|nr:hypothetical protein [Collinsella tanakaei]MCF2621894.1 hypothetical protein [Collinsella tanakaei]